MLVSNPAIASFLSFVILIIGIVILLLIIGFVGKLLIRLIVGVIANSILGFIALGLISYLFGITITLTNPVLVCIALFGLPGVGTLLVLKLYAGLAL